MNERATIADLERRLAEAEAALRANNDFDARRRAEEALRDSEKKYRTLSGTMGQGYAECEMIWGARTAARSTTVTSR